MYNLLLRKILHSFGYLKAHVKKEFLHLTNLQALTQSQSNAVVCYFYHVLVHIFREGDVGPLLPEVVVETSISHEGKDDVGSTLCVHTHSSESHHIGVVE